MQDNGVKADPNTGSQRDGAREETEVPLPRLPWSKPRSGCRSTRAGPPFVDRGHLRIPAARPDVVAQLVKLNPRASTATQ
jgi:hypothetical protein